jgi:hypothetical protein
VKYKLVELKKQVPDTLRCRTNTTAFVCCYSAEGPVHVRHMRHSGGSFFTFFFFCCPDELTPPSVFCACDILPAPIGSLHLVGCRSRTNSLFSGNVRPCCNAIRVGVGHMSRLAGRGRCFCWRYDQPTTNPKSSPLYIWTADRNTP